jgi:hypothetical protein
MEALRLAPDVVLRVQSVQLVHVYQIVRVGTRRVELDQLAVVFVYLLPQPILLLLRNLLL